MARPKFQSLGLALMLISSWGNVSCRYERRPLKPLMYAMRDGSCTCMLGNNRPSVQLPVVPVKRELSTAFSADR